MHASIALCLMMVGGPVPPAPEPEIVNVPLKIDVASPLAMQELEWKTNPKLRRTLPRVPTNNDDGLTAADRRGQGRYVPPTNPNAPQRPQPLMPISPTDPGNLAGGGAPTGSMPAMPGTGTGMGQGYGGQAYAPNRPTAYDPNSVSFGRPVGNLGTNGIQTNAPRATYTPRASDTMTGIYSGANLGSNNGVSANPMLNTSVGGAEKPFNNYQRPSGYSPWMNLYNTPTNNGTVSTYSNTVQPQIQQQQFNRQTAEQIQGVRNLMVVPQAGSTPGMTEMPVSGAGLVNPNAAINYGYYPQR